MCIRDRYYPNLDDIIRSALPYNVSLMRHLKADSHYVWFTLIISLILIIISVSYTHLQYYSHVIHLVSRVSVELNPKANPIKAFIATFPAGTLSGAPKVQAMPLISEYEPHSRGAYGGCIGDEYMRQA